MGDIFERNQEPTPFKEPFKFEWLVKSTMYSHTHDEGHTVTYHVRERNTPPLPFNCSTYTTAALFFACSLLSPWKSKIGVCVCASEEENMENSQWRNDSFVCDSVRIVHFKEWLKGFWLWASPSLTVKRMAGWTGGWSVVIFRQEIVKAWHKLYC